MKNYRQARASELIREELSQILLGEVDDPNLQRFVITSVEPAAKMSSARVLVVPAGKEEFRTERELQRALRSLRQASGFLRHALTQRGELQRVPELHFELDRGIQHGDRINTLLERLRKKSKSGLAVFLLAALAGLGQAQEKQPHKPPREKQAQRYESSATIMGSSYRLAAYGGNIATLASAVRAAFEEARRIDQLLSNYKDESELSRINRSAADGPVDVSEEMADLIQRCLEYSRASEGAFDITVGPLMKVWGFYRGEGLIPGRFTLWRTLGKIGYQNLELDQQRKRLRFSRSGMELDPGGIGKGYAVDKMAGVLDRFGIESAMISAGTSSMYAVGAPPGEPRGWRVGIRDPKDAERTAAEVYLNNESMSTSGSYEKFFEVDGKLYSHIMDPRTGMPAEGVLSVSVISPRTLDSEAWATAFFVNGLEWTRAHLRQDFRVFGCGSGGGCAWLEAGR
ncbi:MAG: 30S ribosome-binding factor RbfA [Bryobacterales bacterium]